MCRIQILLYTCNCEVALSSVQHCDSPTKGCFSYRILKHDKPCPRAVQALNKSKPLPCFDLPSMGLAERIAAEKRVLRGYRALNNKDGEWMSWGQADLVCLFEEPVALQSQRVLDENVTVASLQTRKHMEAIRNLFHLLAVLDMADAQAGEW
jgi:hypothetical protein